MADPIDSGICLAFVNDFLVRKGCNETSKELIKAKSDTNLPNLRGLTLEDLVQWHFQYSQNIPKADPIESGICLGFVRDFLVRKGCEKTAKKLIESKRDENIPNMRGLKLNDLVEWHSEYNQKNEAQVENMDAKSNAPKIADENLDPMQNRRQYGGNKKISKTGKTSLFDNANANDSPSNDMVLESMIQNCKALCADNTNEEVCPKSRNSEENSNYSIISSDEDLEFEERNSNVMDSNPSVNGMNRDVMVTGIVYNNYDTKAFDIKEESQESVQSKCSEDKLLSKIPDSNTEQLENVDVTDLPQHAETDGISDVNFNHNGSNTEMETVIRVSEVSARLLKLAHSNNNLVTNPRKRQDSDIQHGLAMPDVDLNSVSDSDNYSESFPDLNKCVILDSIESDFEYMNLETVSSSPKEHETVNDQHELFIRSRSRNIDSELELQKNSDNPESDNTVPEETPLSPSIPRNPDVISLSKIRQAINESMETMETIDNNNLEVSVTKNNDIVQLSDISSTTEGDSSKNERSEGSEIITIEENGTQTKIQDSSTDNNTNIDSTEKSAKCEKDYVGIDTSSSSESEFWSDSPSDSETDSKILEEKKDPEVSDIPDFSDQDSNSDNAQVSDIPDFSDDNDSNSNNNEVQTQEMSKKALEKNEQSSESSIESTPKKSVNEWIPIDCIFDVEDISDWKEQEPMIFNVIKWILESNTMVRRAQLDAFCIQWKTLGNIVIFPRSKTKNQIKAWSKLEKGPLKKSGADSPMSKVLQAFKELKAELKIEDSDDFLKKIKCFMKERRNEKICQIFGCYLSKHLEFPMHFIRVLDSFLKYEIGEDDVTVDEKLLIYENLKIEEDGSYNIEELKALVSRSEEEIDQIVLPKIKKEKFPKDNCPYKVEDSITILKHVLKNEDFPRNLNDVEAISAKSKHWNRLEESMKRSKKCIGSHWAHFIRPTLKAYFHNDLKTDWKKKFAKSVIESKAIEIEEVDFESALEKWPFCTRGNLMIVLTEKIVENDLPLYKRLQKNLKNCQLSSKYFDKRIEFIAAFKNLMKEDLKD